MLFLSPIQQRRNIEEKYFNKIITHADYVGRQVKFSSPSGVCLSVCPHHNSETNDPKVFKLGTGNDPIVDSCAEFSLDGGLLRLHSTYEYASTWFWLNLVAKEALAK